MNLTPFFLLQASKIDSSILNSSAQYAASLQQEHHPNTVIVTTPQNIITTSGTLAQRQVTINGASGVTGTIPAGATIEMGAGGEVKQVVVDGGVTIEGGELKPTAANQAAPSHVAMTATGQTFLVPLNGQVRHEFVVLLTIRCSKGYGD